MSSSAGRGVLVTGASRGIGAAVATAFAGAGDRVALHCRSSVDRAEAVRATLPGDGHVVVQGDLADPQDVERFVALAAEGLGRIDVLVNNAALFAEGEEGRRLDLSVAHSTYAEWVAGWRRTVDVNLLGTANVTYQVARHMLAVEPTDPDLRGTVVTVGSRGAYRGEPEVPAYGASKAGVHALTQSLAVALAPHGITCVGIAPGFVATDMAAGVLAGPQGDAIRAQSPFGRVASPEEVASAVVQLASPATRWAAGAILDYNGASHLR